MERQAREAMVATRDKEKEKLQKQALEIRELRLKLNEQSQRTLEEGVSERGKFVGRMNGHHNIGQVAMGVCVYKISCMQLSM